MSEMWKRRHSNGWECSVELVTERYVAMVWPYDRQPNDLHRATASIRALTKRCQKFAIWPVKQAFVRTVCTKS